MKYSKELKVGVISIVTIIAFWWLFQFLKGNDVFASGYIYYIEFSNVDGLQPTKAVSINGLQVGKVISIDPIYEGQGKYKFKVKIMVDKDFKFNQGTVAEIYEPGLMAGKEIRLLLSDTPPLVKNESYIQGKVGSSISDVLGEKIVPLEANLNNVLKNLDSTLTVTRKVLNQTANGELAATIKSANGTLNSFQKTSDNANLLITQNSGKLNSLLGKANIMIDDIDKTVNKYGTVADKVNGMDIEQSFAKLDGTMTEITTLLQQINKNEGTLGKILTDKSLYDNLNQTSENLNKLLKDVDENPKRFFQISVFGKKDKPVKN